jgi:hypothetical protein
MLVTSHLRPLARLRHVKVTPAVAPKCATPGLRLYLRRLAYGMCRRSRQPANIESAMATLEQIQTKIQNLQAQAGVVAAKNVHAVLGQICELMLTHGLTTADFEAKSKAKRAAKD